MVVESEKYIERKLVELCKRQGALCIKLITSQFIGLPDRMCLFSGGRIVFIEIKTTGEKPRKIQVNVHKTIRSLGFRVEVIDSMQSLLKLLADYE